MRRNYMSLALCMLALGIALGAFGAHGLEGKISNKYAEVWETASRYWIYSALIIMSIVNFIGNEKKHRITKQVYGTFGALNLFILGSCLFSFSLWTLSLHEIIGSGFKKLGVITPLGGGLMIVSLLLITFILFRHNNQK